MDNYFLLFIVLFFAFATSVIQGGGTYCQPQLSFESSKLPVQVGGEVIIKCRACAGRDIFWFKDGKRFGETERIHWIPDARITSYPLAVEGKLKITKLRRKDRGVYTCYALDFFTNLHEKGDIRLVVKGHRHNSLVKILNV